MLVASLQRSDIERGQSEQQGPLGDRKGRGHTPQPLDMQEQGIYQCLQKAAGSSHHRFTQSK